MNAKYKCIHLTTIIMYVNKTILFLLWFILLIQQNYSWFKKAKVLLSRQPNLLIEEQDVFYTDPQRDLMKPSDVSSNM